MTYDTPEQINKRIQQLQIKQYKLRNHEYIKKTQYYQISIRRVKLQLQKNKQKLIDCTQKSKRERLVEKVHKDIVNLITLQEDYDTMRRGNKKGKGKKKKK